MENIYFQPNKENSEFLDKLEKLDEYTIPQILERMVDHFRTLPELEDALNKLGIKTDSLEEELDDDITVKENFWVGGKPMGVAPDHVSTTPTTSRLHSSVRAASASAYHERT